jgi:hypothetical protein
MTSQTNIPASPIRTLGEFFAFTAATAITAAMATFASVAFALPVWAVFIGWVAYDTRGQSARDGIANLTCLLLGVAFGMATALAITVLTPTLGSASTAVAVFGVAIVVVSLRAVPVINNILSYFLGVISFFAVQLEPTLPAFVELASASALGGLAGWVASTAQTRIARTA